MAYTNFHWIEDRFAIGGLVQEADDNFPFEAVMSLETHAPARLRGLAEHPEVEYRWFSIIDGYSWVPNDEIVQHFDRAAAQIDAWIRSGKRVLVHCTAGVSRSVTAAAWYLVRYHGFSWDDALALIQAYRPQANPNPRFEIPLRIAAGEPVTPELVWQRVELFCRRMRQDYPGNYDPHEIVQDLIRQGTLAEEYGTEIVNS